MTMIVLPIMEEWETQIRRLHELMDEKKQELFIGAAMVHGKVQLSYKTLPLGHLRKLMKATRHETPSQDNTTCVSDQSVPTDLAFLQILDLSSEKIVTTIRDLLSKMEIAKNNIVLDFRAEKAIRHVAQTLNITRTRRSWLGSDCLRLLPIIDPNWSLWKLEQATVEGGRFRVSRVTWGGSAECPFQEASDLTYYGYCYGNHDIVIENLQNDSSIAISSLTLHMISEHKNFNEATSPYRLNLAKLFKVLFSIKTS
jgi:hypothetical protein